VNELCEYQNVRCKYKKKTGRILTENKKTTISYRVHCISNLRSHTHQLPKNKHRLSKGVCNNCADLLVEKLIRMGFLMERHGLGPIVGAHSFETRIRLSKGNAIIQLFSFRLLNAKPWVRFLWHPMWYLLWTK